MKKILPFILWMVTLSASAQTKFTDTYQLNQPKDCWHIAFKDLSTGLSTWAGRIGEKYAQATESGDEQGTIYQRFNFKTRRGYQCFSMNAPITAPMKHFDDAGGDTDSGFVHFFKDYAPEDPDACIPWELVEFGIVTTGDDEQRGTVMQRFHNLGWPASKLAQYYVGDELACGVKCWKFDTRKKPVSGSVGAIYWIDPSNGLCLKQQASDGSGFEVFIYDLQYQEWTIDLYPEAFLDK